MKPQKTRVIVLSATVTSKLDSDRVLQLFELFLCFDLVLAGIQILWMEIAHQLKDNLKSIIA